MSKAAPERKKHKASSFVKVISIGFTLNTNGISSKLWIFYQCQVLSFAGQVGGKVRFTYFIFGAMNKSHHL